MENTLLVQFPERGFARRPVPQQPYLEKLFLQEFLPRVAQQFGHERIGVGNSVGAGVNDEYPILSRFEETPIANFGKAHGFQLFAFSDVINSEKNSLGSVRLVGIQPSGVEQHRAASDPFKVVRDLEVIEETVPGQNVFQQLAQLGYVPLAVAEFINQAPICLAGWDLEGLVKGSVRGVNPQLRRQDQERISCRPQNGF